MTSFYSWRLMFMTFHGPTRADQETFDHAHESPLVMLVPLALLATGATLAGMVFNSAFIGVGHGDHGDPYKAFWATSIFKGKDNHVLHAMHEVPHWVGWAPIIAMLAGFVLAYLYYIPAPWLPAATARAFRPLYLFLLNKWYFDELYDWLFVRPTLLARQRPVEGRRRRRSSTAPIDGTASGVLEVTSRVGASCRPATSITTPSPC